MSTIINNQIISKGLIDSHFHSIMLKNRGLDPDRVITEVFNAEYAAILDIGTDSEDIAVRKEALSAYPYAYMSVGLYPSHCDKNDLIPRLDIICNSLKNDKVIAVGEIGLDYHWNYGTPSQQQNLFIQQLEIAKTNNVPVLIHNRDADDDITVILKEADLPSHGIIHCFSSNKQTAKHLLDLGYYISFAGNVTYPKSTDIQEALIYVPKDRILLETDAPYLAPQKKRGKPNHPGYIQYTYQYAAQMRKTAVEDLIFQIQLNFKNLFNVSLQE